MMSKNIDKKPEGFIALITAIALSLILLVVTVTLNQSGFLTRSTLLDAEYKERSSALAEACIDTALLKLANDPSYLGPDLNIAVGSSDTCDIRPVITTGSQKTIQTRAIFQEAETNLEVVVDTNLSIISWNELPNFP